MKMLTNRQLLALGDLVDYAIAVAESEAECCYLQGSERQSRGFRRAAARVKRFLVIKKSVWKESVD